MPLEHRQKLFTPYAFILELAITTDAHLHYVEYMLPERRHATMLLHYAIAYVNAAIIYSPDLWISPPIHKGQASAHSAPLRYARLLSCCHFFLLFMSARPKHHAEILHTLKATDAGDAAARRAVAMLHH